MTTSPEQLAINAILGQRDLALNKCIELEVACNMFKEQLEEAKTEITALKEKLPKEPEKVDEPVEPPAPT